MIAAMHVFLSCICPLWSQHHLTFIPERRAPQQCVAPDIKTLVQFVYYRSVNERPQPQLQNECRTTGRSIAIYNYTAYPPHLPTKRYCMDYTIFISCRFSGSQALGGTTSSLLPQTTTVTNLDDFNAKLLKSFVCWNLSGLHCHPLGAKHQSVHGEPFGCHPEWMAVRNHRLWSINHFPTSFDKEFLCLVAPSVWVLHQ